MGAVRKNPSTNATLIRRTTHGFSSRLLASSRSASITLRSLSSLPLGLLLAGPGLGHAAHEDEVLPKGMTLELFWENQLDQLRMTLEVDAEQLPRLTLVPVRSGVQVVDGRGPRLLAVTCHLHPDAVPVPGRVQLYDQLQALFLAVDRRDEVEEVESQLGIVPKHLHELSVAGRSHLHHCLPVGLRGVQEVLAELRPQTPDDLSGRQG